MLSLSFLVVNKLCQCDYKLWTENSTLFIPIISEKSDIQSLSNDGDRRDNNDIAEATDVETDEKVSNSNEIVKNDQKSTENFILFFRNIHIRNRFSSLLVMNFANDSCTME